MTKSIPVPDFPFDYNHWVRHPAGLGSLPGSRHGTPVAVVGGGLSGLVAAYELMRLGLRPVLYEPGQIGGRMRSEPFPENPGFFAELGAMRFAPSGQTLFHYVDLLGLTTEPFPNPLAPCTPTTVIDLNGVVHRGHSLDDLPDIYQNVMDAWDKTLRDQAELPAMRDALLRQDVPLVKAIWNRLVTDLDDESFYGFLARSAAFSSFRYREIFGQVGFGTGGWDAEYRNSILEILRVVFTEIDADHVGIREGSQQVPLRLWRHSPRRMAHWPAGTSLASLNGGAPAPGVRRIGRSGDLITIEDGDRNSRAFPAVVFTPHVWTLLAPIDCAPELLTPAEWTAVERTHYAGSSKLFVLTDRPFWKDIDPRHGHETMSMTLTDRSPRGVYLFDHGPDKPGVMCLSYTWNDDSAKALPLDDRQRLRVLLRRLARTYPGVDIESHIISEPVTVTWEREPHFMGAFKANLPGQYRYQRRLFTHFMQDGRPQEQRGFFLCGDDISWTAGYAEGAVTTALNAVWGVLHHLGGGTDPTNPGPGDVFDQMAPVALPE